MGRAWGKGWNKWQSSSNSKPYWRQFVDPSDDPAVISWCRQRISEFLRSGDSQQEMEWLSNSYRNTIRSLAPEMGAAWLKVSKGVYALARPTGIQTDPSVLREKLVESVRQICEQAGGQCKVSHISRELPQELWVSAAAELKLRNLKQLPESCRKECQLAELRLVRNSFSLGDADGYADAVFVRFSASRLAAAAAALSAVKAPRRVARQRSEALDFLRRDARAEPRGLSSAEMSPLWGSRQRLPAFALGPQICAAIRRHQVTLILGATGCGKTTQVPQFILEDFLQRSAHCRIVATQPRRISAVSVAERVAKERNTRLGESVSFKIRFEDKIEDTTQVVFCTVGILLKVMQSNPNLDGATHIIVDEVHERDLHTDFLLILLRRVLNERPDLKLVLMSATVDPSAFQSYFEGIHTVSIPGKTNFPIQELFLEEILPKLPDRPGWRRSGKSNSKGSMGQKPLPVPQDERALAEALQLPMDLATDLAWVHQQRPEDIDYELVVQVVQMIHGSNEPGGILIFMPGWFELPTWEQQAIFAPQSGRKVVVATVLAETSITVEDIVYVVDCGRSRSTFLNEDTKISALRTVWYSKANGFQRRGRAGRCRPGVWFRLFSSLQWEAMDEYQLPEMQRSPLEELCLEVASLQLGRPVDFLAEALSPPSKEVLQHALELLHRLGAVTDAEGHSLTPLGEQLARLQVHPMLGKLLLLSVPFRCHNQMLTICASLGYKSPFQCPMGMEKAANQARLNLAQKSRSDLIALVNAYEGWRVGKRDFARRNFLSHETLDYIHRLREDLRSTSREVLSTVPEDHTDPDDLAEACKAVLTAGLFPNLAWLQRRGKGKSISGLPVVVHPGSVNSTEEWSTVVFYEIQETSNRFLYDSTVVGLAPSLLFAPSRSWREVHRGKRVVVELEQSWHVAVDVQVADELFKLRQLVANFLDTVVGRVPSQWQLDAAAELQKLFAEKVATAGGDVSDADTEMQSVAEDAW
ncbi:unnamed protein product [Effrenium voratum]|uniref:RNA helicase n=1 Tax=Effrenium voratum TaxID=2562239 RepID=A0AA36I415_9DINO|nr:unnamed protein product [Effrenium voratum]